MALRKFSKYMKVVTILVLFAFAFSAAYAGYSSIVSHLKNKKEVVAKIDGMNIYKDEYTLEINKVKKTLEKYGKPEGIKEEVYEMAALSNLIDLSLNKKISKDLKVNVSSSSINEEVLKLEEQYGGREKLAVLLAQNGLNLKLVKDQIKEQLLFKNTLDKLKEEIKPTDEDLKLMYKRFKYTQLNGMEFEKSIDKLKEIYKNSILESVYLSKLNEMFLNSKISTKDEKIEMNYNNLKNKDLIVSDIEVLKKDLLNIYISKYISDKKYSEEANDKVISQEKIKLEKLVEIANKAKKENLKAIEGLTPLYKANDLKDKYINKLINDYKPTDKEAKEWFDKFRENYDTKNTISCKFIGLDYKPLEADYKLAETKIKEIKSKATIDNFSMLATENSQDPGSAKNGGDLGWADVRTYVPEFSKVLEYKKGEITDPIKTQYGYHIVYVVDKDEKDKNRVNLKHILIRPEISEETKNIYIKKMKDLMDEISNKKVNVEDVLSNKDKKYDDFKIRREFNDITRDINLPYIGNDKKIMEELFTIKEGETLFKELKNMAIMIIKDKEIAYKKANFDEFRERVETEISIANVINELK